MAFNSSAPIQDNTSMAGKSNRLLAPQDGVGCSESPEQKENVTTIPRTLGTSWISHLLMSPREGVREEAEGGNSMSMSTGSPTVIRGSPSSLSFADPNDILQPASQEQERLFQSRAVVAA